jgi:hypothetical protein
MEESFGAAMHRLQTDAGITQAELQRIEHGILAIARTVPPRTIFMGGAHSYQRFTGMQPIPADATTDHDREMRHILDEHPKLKERITRMANGYRSLLQNCLEQMAEARVDVADTVIALYWRDMDANLLGIPLANVASEEAKEKQEGDICSICGGVTPSWYQSMLTEAAKNPGKEVYTPVLPAPFRMCGGHPEPVLEHDGKLDDYTVSYSTVCTVWGQMEGVLLKCEGGPEQAGLTYKQGLSLLAWLQQEQTTLEKLAKEQSSEE